MKRISKFLLVVISLLFLSQFISCEEESTENEVTELETVVVKQYELIPLVFDAGILTMNEYNATFGITSITLNKYNDTVLMLAVPAVEPNSVYDLEIDGLGLYKNNFEVIEVVLTGSPDEILTSVNSGISSFANSLPDTSEYKGVISNYSSQLADYISSLNVSEKQATAYYYEANKEIFEEILYDNYEEYKSTEDCIFCVSTLTKFKVSVLALGTGAAVAKFAPTLADKSIGVGIALVGFIKAKQFGTEITFSRLKILGITIGSILGEKQDDLTFSNGVAKEMEFQTNNRVLSNSDRDDNVSDVLVFFNSFDKFNTIINTINTVITFVNDNVFFSDIDLLPAFSLETLSNATYNVETEIFENYSFSVDDSNVEVISELSEDGVISLTMNVDENYDYSDPLELQLLVKYEDDFNDLEKSFSAQISDELETIIDIRDGQEYKIVTIGDQTWLAENMNYYTGDSWWYENSSENGDIYGRLYTWDAAHNACPDGWHLPSIQEWEELIDYVGGEDIAAYKLKSMEIWQEGYEGDNYYNFSALPGGYRGFVVYNFYYLGTYASFWTNEEVDEYNAIFYTIHLNGDYINQSDDDKPAGRSVRCIKDINN